MSRLGKKPIELPKGVEIKQENNKVIVKGPKGTLEKELDGVVTKVDGSNLIVTIEEKALLKNKSLHGLYWALIKNMVNGVAKGFEKRLSLVGVGYRAAIKGTKIDLQIGFSHPTLMEIPKELSVKIDKQGTEIIVTGSDNQLVGQFAASVRAKRKPEPYKGKGIRYVNEHVRKKAGKAAKGK